MNILLKMFLSMSFSGSLFILLLLAGKRFLKDKISRQWQYYIWLIVVVRLLLPFGPETNLMGKAYQAIDQAITHSVSLPEQPSPSDDSNAFNVSASGMEHDNQNTVTPKDNPISYRPVKDILSLFTNHVWLIWLMVALILLVQKITAYHSFIRYVNAGLHPVSNVEQLDRLSAIAEQAGRKRPVELCVNPLVSSPLLIGFFRPCIVLPSADIPEKDFQYIVLHELTHYKRRDMFYKWLVQITVCLHWFNPLVYLMRREITKACEFSCDEAVLSKMGYDNAQDYGETLLDAMAAVGKYKESLAAVTLSENKQLLKERLGAIMNLKRKSKTTLFVTSVLTLCIILGATFVGVYPAAAADQPSNEPTVSGLNENAIFPAQEENGSHNGVFASQAEQYYEADNLPLFEIAFSRLDEKAQGEWLDKIYADDQIRFWKTAVNMLDEDCALISHYAEKIYDDDNIPYFSTLTSRMSEETLEGWLDIATDDEKFNFQSILSNALGQGNKFDTLSETQKAEYQAVGITVDGNNHYYQGQLVNIFLDMHRLAVNPAGTVNIRITRSEDGKISDVAYMTDTEVTELLGNMEEPDDLYDAEMEELLNDLNDSNNK